MNITVCAATDMQDAVFLLLPINGNGEIDRDFVGTIFSDGQLKYDKEFNTRSYLTVARLLQQEEMLQLHSLEVIDEEIDPKDLFANLEVAVQLWGMQGEVIEIANDFSRRKFHLLRIE